jgi:hypothetical protein
MGFLIFLFEFLGGNYGPRYGVLELQFAVCAQNLLFKETVVLLRPHAGETVRGWMTTFERLHTVSEESTEQIVEPQQTRVTRTKTRAMSKAAAAAAESASTKQEISILTDLPNNVSLIC